MSLDQTLLNKVKLANALLCDLMKGPVYHDSLPLCGKTRLSKIEMFESVQYLNECGIEVSRVDSGGTPTWEILSVNRKLLKENGDYLKSLL